MLFFYDNVGTAQMIKISRNKKQFSQLMEQLCERTCQESKHCPKIDYFAVIMLFICERSVQTTTDMENPPVFFSQVDFLTF